MIRPLPAGLLNDQIEFFHDPNNIEHAYYLTAGRVGRVMEAPENIKAIIRTDIAAHPGKVEALVEFGYEGEDEQLEKYISCLSGAFDGEPDVINGMLQHKEYVPCPVRGICPVEGRLCNSLLVGPNDKPLTKREIETLILISQGLQNKEIADQMNISYETVKIFIKHIMEKSELNNRAELVLLAHQKNLI